MPVPQLREGGAWQDVILRCGKCLCFICSDLPQGIPNQYNVVQHGGGVRCKLEGCNRVAIGKAQLCRAHGGGANSHFMSAAI